jgi:hypothetical protein
VNVHDGRTTRQMRAEIPGGSVTREINYATTERTVLVASRLPLFACTANFSCFRCAAFRHKMCISTRHSLPSRNGRKSFKTKDRVRLYSTVKTDPPKYAFLALFQCKSVRSREALLCVRSLGKSLVCSAFTSRVSAPAIDVGRLLHRFACGAAILFRRRTGTIWVRTLFIGSHLNSPFGVLARISLPSPSNHSAQRATMTIHHLAEFSLWLCCTDPPAAGNTTANFNLGGAPLRIQWETAPSRPGIPTW